MDGRIMTVFQHIYRKSEALLSEHQCKSRFNTLSISLEVITIRSTSVQQDIDYAHDAYFHPFLCHG